MKYRIMLGQLSFNYNIDYVLDRYLKHFISIGISKVSYSKHTSEVIFKDGSMYEFWNSNKYHAWLSSGTVYSSQIKYQYNNARPTAKTMYLFKKAVEEFHSENIKNIQTNSVN